MLFHCPPFGFYLKICFTSSYIGKGLSGREFGISNGGFCVVVSSSGGGKHGKTTYEDCNVTGCKSHEETENRSCKV